MSIRDQHASLVAQTFIDPRGRNVQEVDEFIAEAVRLVLELATSSSERPPFPEMRSEAEEVPIEGRVESLQEMLGELRWVVERSANLAHPGFVAHMDPPATLASIVADLVTSVVNNNMLFQELSPALTRLEGRLLRRFARLFGLGEDASGLMLPGGSLANIQALAMVRNAARARPGGESLVIVTSDAAHSSIDKAAMLIGTSVVRAPTNHGRLDPAVLVETIEQVIASKRRPLCVVATAGTTLTGAIDPLQQVGKIARQYGLWFHVDAAFGGALVLSPKHRNLLRGIEQADSLTFNPQKWLYVARTSAMLLMRRGGDFERFFRVEAPYAGGDRIERGEISLQGTSRTDVLKLWLSLRHIGEEGYATLIDQSIECAPGEPETAKVAVHRNGRRSPVDRDLLSYRPAVLLGWICRRMESLAAPALIVRSSAGAFCALFRPPALAQDVVTEPVCTRGVGRTSLGRNRRLLPKKQG